MIERTLAAGLFVLATPAFAQQPEPSTWRDPDTRCVYLKVGDTLSLRYRRDGTPDCASVQRDVSEEAISRNDFRELARSIEALRRDIGDVRRVMADMGREIEAMRRQAGRPAQ
ncbi:MAG TPA: hypothetical protein VIL09_02080 [Microvirga sp.]|jgi:hypothetical protein